MCQVMMDNRSTEKGKSVQKDDNGHNKEMKKVDCTCISRVLSCISVELSNYSCPFVRIGSPRVAMCPKHLLYELVKCPCFSSITQKMNLCAKSF